MFPGVEELTGDRAAGELDALRGRRWDAVIDNSASRADAPDWVRDSAGLLKDQADQYLFISTRSVFRTCRRVPATVDAPLLTKETTPELDRGAALSLRPGQGAGGGRGGAAFGERTTIVRPGLIVGPGRRHGPVHLLAGADRAGRRDPGSRRPGGGPGPGHRRPGPVRVGRAPVRGPHLRHLHGRGPGERPVHGGVPVRDRGRDHRPAELDLGPPGVPGGARDPTLPEMPVWRPPTPGLRGVRPLRPEPGGGGGAHLPVPGRHDPATLDFHHSRERGAGTGGPGPSRPSSWSVPCATR
jgi:hypothetical protein